MLPDEREAFLALGCGGFTQYYIIVKPASPDPDCKISLLLTPMTVAEAVWVLESFYGHSKAKIAETMGQFLFCDGLEVEDLHLIIEALTLYQGRNLDFADAFLAAIALRKNPQSIYSFDQHFNRISGITGGEPGKD